MEQLINATEGLLQHALESQKAESYEDVRTYIQAALANLDYMKKEL